MGEKRKKKKKRKKKEKGSDFKIVLLSGVGPNHNWVFGKKADRKT